MTITGVNLVGPGVPTEVRIGDQTLTRIDGPGRITGILEESPPEGIEVVVAAGGDQAHAPAPMTHTRLGRPSTGFVLAGRESA